MPDVLVGLRAVAALGEPDDARVLARLEQRVGLELAPVAAPCALLGAREVLAREEEDLPRDQRAVDLGPQAPGEGLREVDVGDLGAEGRPDRGEREVLETVLVVLQAPQAARALEEVDGGGGTGTVEGLFRADPLTGDTGLEQGRHGDRSSVIATPLTTVDRPRLTGRRSDS